MAHPGEIPEAFDPAEKGKKVAKPAGTVEDLEKAMEEELMKQVEGGGTV